MLIRKPFYLFLFFGIFSCKKDKPAQTYTYKGVALYIPGNKPVADAKVTLSINPAPPNELPQFASYSTQTNAQGEFEFSINETGPEYWLNAAKTSLIAASHSLINTTTRNDTIYFQDPAYVRVIVKIKKQPLFYYSVQWGFADNAGWMGFEERKTYFGTVSADTILCAYAPRITSKAVVSLYEYLGPPYYIDSTMLSREITPDPTKTSEMLIEY